MKVLVVGEVYSSNLGDGIICEVVDGLLKNQFETSFVDLSGRKEFEIIRTDYEKFSYLKSEIRYVKSIIKSYLHKLGYKKSGGNLSVIIQNFIEEFNKKISNFSPDLIFFAGGQMFIEAFVNQILYVCDFAEVNKIPVFFNACGIGNLDSQSVQKVKKILNSDSVEFISVRDGIESFRKLSQKEIIDTYDTAILSKYYYSIDSNVKNELGIGIMLSSLQSVRYQINFWDQLLQSLVAQNINFKVFTNGSKQDYLFAKYLLDRNGIELANLVAKPNYPHELVQTISSFKAIISMRLHSLIVAYSLNVPTIAISWDNKVKTFYEKIGSSQSCYELIEPISSIMDNLEEKLKYQYNEDKKKSIETSILKNFEVIKNCRLG